MDDCGITATAVSGGDPATARKSDIGSGASPVIGTFNSTTGTRTNYSLSVGGCVSVPGLVWLAEGGPRVGFATRFAYNIATAAS